MRIKLGRQSSMILLATIISLIVSLLPVTAALAIGQQQVIFYDGFNSGQVSKWTPVDCAITGAGTC